MTEEVQAVVDEAKTGAAPPVEVENAREGDDIESLLKQFEDGTKVVDSPPEPKSRDELVKQIAGQVRASIQSEQENRSAISSLVKTVRGEVPENVMSDEEIEDWLNGQAQRNTNLAKAWMARASNSGAWKKIEAELGKKLNSKWQNLPDPQATADREAVANAVRGSSAKVPPESAPDFGNMSDAEFREYTRKNFKF